MLLEKEFFNIFLFAKIFNLSFLNSGRRLGITATASFCMRILVNHGKELYIPKVRLTGTVVPAILNTSLHS